MSAVCNITGCKKQVQARGYCPMHLQQAYKAKAIPVTPKHGYSSKYPVEYKIWCGIRSRCYCKSATNYDTYGANGIKMSDAWYNDFMAFYNDMGPRPAGNYEIDRIDPRGDYCKENCRWLPADENKRRRGKSYTPPFKR